GDVDVEARWLVARGLALALVVGLPTGDSGEYAGAGSLSGELRAVAGAQVGPLQLAGNVGLRLRDEARLGPVAPGNAITLGARVVLPVGAGADLLAALYGAVGLVDEMGPATPLEGSLGVRLAVARGLSATAGLGLGLHDGVGAADARFFV